MYSFKKKISRFFKVQAYFQHQKKKKKNSKKLDKSFPNCQMNHLVQVTLKEDGNISFSFNSSKDASHDAFAPAIKDIVILKAQF